MVSVFTEKVLTALGVLPFLGLSFFSHTTGDLTYNFYFTLYSLIIIAFLAGSHWGLAHSHEIKKSYLFRSNFLTIICGIMACLSLYSPLGLIFLFGYALYADKKLLDDGIIHNEYYQIRLYATVSVSLILLTHIFQS